MSGKIELSKLTLTTKEGSEIDLTVAEAKDLYEQLRQLFEQKTVLLPSAPIFIERNHWPYWNPYGPTWVTSGSDDYSCVTCQAQSGLAVNYYGREV
jgi:hypothetical protein